MSKTTIKTITISMILLTTMLLAILGQAIMVANAQTDVATVIIQPSLGGTTDPAAGTYTYANGTNFVLNATADAGYTFQYWVVSGDYTPGHGTTQATYIIDPDTGNVIAAIPRAGSTGIDSLTFTNNPANISHGFGYTYVYQAVFAPNVAPTPSPTNNTTPTNDTAIVIMEPTTGGTTNPPMGTYAYANGTNFVLTATPDSTHTFQYWIVNGNFTPGHTTGLYDYIYDDNGTLIAQIPRPTTNSTVDSLTFTNNPANVSHGYGYTYAYTAIFALIPPSPSPSPTPSQTVAPTPTPTATPSPSPTPAADNTTVWIIVIVVVVIIVIAAIAAVMMRRNKK